MIKTLYKPFQRWSEKGSVYLISDTHFGDPDREYMGYNISEQEQIKILKKYCHKGDTLIHLGDVGNPSYLSDIECYKVLIMGNHDQSASKFQWKENIIDLDGKTQKEINMMFKTKQINHISYEYHAPFVRGYKSNNLFNEVYAGPIWIAEKLVLSHEPLEITFGGSVPICFNIHGHDHSGLGYNDDYHLNLAQNIWGYFPLNLNQFIKQGYLKNIESAHRATINKRIERNGIRL